MIITITTSKMTSMSSMTLSVSIPFNTDLWLNLDSNKSVLSWYKSIYNRRKKIKNNMKKLKESSSTKKKGNIFNLIINQDADYESKEWKQTYFEFCEKNQIEEDDISEDCNCDDNIFRLFK